MLPVIAIVGRPNVGKSTLFNCLTRSRNALVSDFPGMTRDRQYGEGIFHDQSFLVIDTGGLTEEKNDLDQLMAKQSFQAMQEADAILFLVDAKNGLTPDDFVITEKLRKQLTTETKPIFLVINKAEGKDPDLITPDFYQLGFQEVHCISAAHNRGVADLIEVVLDSFPKKAPEITNTEGIKIALVGKPNVGKSTLTNRMLGEERVIVFDQPGTTRDSIFISLERLGKDYTLIDTAGLRRRGKVFETTEKFSVVKTLQAVEACDVVLFLIDAREKVTDQDLKLLGFVLDSGRALVIAINKWDGMTPDEKEETRITLDRRLNFVPFVRIHFISALHGSGVGDLFTSIDEAYHSAHKKLSTPMLTKILQEAVVQHAPPLVQGRRIKLRYAHSGGHHPPLIIVHGNQVRSVPDVYLRYLANTFQKRLNLMGTPVRVEVKGGENPFRHKKTELTSRQIQKKKRLMRHVKKK